MEKITKSKFDGRIHYDLIYFPEKCVILRMDFSNFAGELNETVPSETIAVFGIKEKENAEKFFDLL